MQSTLIKKLLLLNRMTKQLIMMLFDSVLIVSVLLSSFSIRLGYWFWPNEELFWVIFVAPVIAIPIFISFRLYRAIVRYIGFKVLSSILQAVTLYAVIWGLLGYVTTIEGVPLAEVLLMPRSVILINWMLIFIVLSGSRIIARQVFTEKEFLTHGKKSNVIIYGAGAAGRQLSHALQLSKEYNHIAYIDDDLTQNGNYINSVPVFSYNKIHSLIEDKKVSEVLLALPSISRKNRNEIIKKLRLLHIQVRSMPSVSELAKGNVKIDDLLEINIRDLLGRDPVSPNNELLKTNIFKKSVLVTGAGGSIGSELCRQIVSLKPKKLILYDISESSLYIIEQELLNFNVSSVEIFPVIGSIADKNRMKVVFMHYGVQTIYHAAAYKHVPLVEYNPSQGILNNAIGTMIAAEAAISTNIETFVLISTDKAVRPTSIMGASKRVAELVLQALDNEHPNTCFTMVRFGNVLDSSGSVIPLFKNQIKAGGPLTVTHVDVVRYFMTIPEAVELVVQAGAMAKGGEVFVLDMGEPIRIYDLAVKMIKLSGLDVLDKNNPDGDIEIKYTGLRPGEKLYEELLVDGNFSLTENKLIMRAKEQMISWDKLEPVLAQIKEAAINAETKKSYKLLHQLVPQFNPESNGFDVN